MVPLIIYYKQPKHSKLEIEWDIFFLMHFEINGVNECSHTLIYDGEELIHEVLDLETFVDLK